MDSDFQRGEVWTLPKKQKLIDTILRGWPIPPIQIVKLKDTEEILDGLQRVTSIIEFLKGEYSIDGTIQPKNSDLEILDGLTFSDIEKKADSEKDPFYKKILNTILSTSISAYYIQNPTSEEIAELFYRFNSPMQLNPVEKRNAFMGDTRTQIKQLNEYFIESGARKETLGFNDIRGLYEDILVKVCYFFEFPDRRVIKLTTDKLVELYRENHKFSDRTISTIKVYIDEPCNYLSYFSLQNFSKLLIKSSAVAKNEFYLTTNNLDLIDNLLCYDVDLKIIFNYPEGTSEISKEDYYSIFCARYQKKEEIKRVIFVEDVLAKKFLDRLFPNEEIVFVQGEGNLRIVDRFSALNTQFKFPEIRVIYDGDQKDRQFRLPFDDVESYVIYNYQKIIDSKIPKATSFRIEDSIKRLEKHDAYLEILNILNLEEEQCLDRLVKEYRDGEWFEEISNYINNVITSV